MISLPSMANLKPRERLLAAGAGVIVLLVLLDRLVLNPWLAHVARVRQETRRMEETLLRNQQLLARRSNVETEQARYQRYLQPALADDLQMAALLKEMEGLAAESEVEVIEIKPLGVEADESMRRYTLEVRFGCSLEGWVKFVYLTESSPSLFEIVRASLAVPDAKPEELEGTLRVVSAALAPPSPVQAADAEEAS